MTDYNCNQDLDYCVSINSLKPINSLRGYYLTTAFNMKILLVIAIIVFTSIVSALGQSKKDSLNLKKDIEAISKGRKIPPPKKQSILNGGDSLPVKIDSMAMKPGLPQPIPTRPNNPNPHEPVPSPVNPSPPATPPVYPQVPVVSPKGQESAPKKVE